MDVVGVVHMHAKGERKKERKILGGDDGEVVEGGGEELEQHISADEDDDEALAGAGELLAGNHGGRSSGGGRLSSMGLGDGVLQRLALHHHEPPLLPPQISTPVYLLLPLLSLSLSLGKLQREREKGEAGRDRAEGLRSSARLLPSTNHPLFPLFLYPLHYSNFFS